DDMELATDRLFKFLEPLENDILKNLVILKNQQTALKKEEMAGTMKPETARQSRADLCHRLLALLERLEVDPIVVAHFDRVSHHFRETLPPSKVVARLTSHDHRVSNKSFELSRKAIIGRNIDCDIVINDPSISRNHAQLYVKNNLIYIEDMGSMNKTFLNDMEVKVPTIIQQNCIVKFYNIPFILDLTI
ncbi:MAG: FHA domain-containing protein, partial [Saprospiraceae bacterium]